MTPSFNDMPEKEARRTLQSCFANLEWAVRVSAGRPYADLGALMAAADSAWAELSAGDWLSAFAAHPRIGESGGHAPEKSRLEQGEVARAGGETLAELAAENRRYEQRFGHIFIIAAQGRGAAEILEELRGRMGNEAATELEIAMREQRMITRSRLEQLFEA